jgi:threonine dehydrogenase-like Zn-dependent dehydrogenase
MNELDLRALVREAVERHLGRRASPAPESEPVQAAAGAIVASHASHGVYLTLVNAGDACVIEPSVPCTHCNYCRSHGH